MRIFLFLLTYFLSLPLMANVDISHLFVHLSDAMAEVKKGESYSALPHLNALQADFERIPTNYSQAGKTVHLALTSAKITPDDATFEHLSRALLAFEKEQNPIDYNAKREQFVKRVMPIYQQLNHVTQTQNLEELEQVYKRFNTTWTVNEKIVREVSLGHYGQIETAMTLFRVAMLSEPANFVEMNKQLQHLGNALTSFKSGELIQSQQRFDADAPQTLAEGIELLKRGYNALENGQKEKAQADITLFIQQWTIFEGEVSTRDGGLYTRVETELPLIMAKPDLIQFKALIDSLEALELEGSYTFIDAMLILLREGIEALLIIMALLTTLKVTKQPEAKRWIYLGAGGGILASLVGAITLHQFFPAISAGMNREILEGVVGIIAVGVMLFVGAWLHSKSSIEGWKKFMDQQVGHALATGSLFSMMLLSFLSVFREGAETILFYVGMLPRISNEALLLGIGSAIALLMIIAIVMTKSSQKLPIPQLFKMMTWLIYALGFKILGVSINALQLTQTLPRHIILDIPSFQMIGWYASWEGGIIQLLYLSLILFTVKYFR